MVAAIVGIVLLLGMVVPAGAEVSSEVSIDVYNSLIFAEGGAAEGGASDEDIAAAGAAVAQLDLRSTGNRDVRSWFQLRSTLAHRADGTAATIVDVPRAEIRWRMTAGDDYTMRYTVGRTRLTWGDGVLYNAGDVLNGPTPDAAATDLTADTLRDETLWLVSGYFPAGRFSFFEPVLLIPMNTLFTEDDVYGGDEATAGSGPAAETTVILPPASDIAAGGRLQGHIAGIKSEIGYLYRGTTDDHRPYLSVQGNLVLDWYAGASWSSAAEDSVVSGGLLYNGVTDRHGSWSVRTEALWETGRDAVELFPEVTWSPSQLFSLFLRALTSTDGTAVNGASGFTWTPSTGLSLSLYGTTDTKQEIGAVTTAVSYVF